MFAPYRLKTPNKRTKPVKLQPLPKSGDPALALALHAACDRAAIKVRPNIEQRRELYRAIVRCADRWTAHVLLDCQPIIDKIDIDKMIDGIYADFRRQLRS